MPIHFKRNPNYLNDCHFFFNSTCTKGADCEFRHSIVALENTRVCQKWRYSQCDDVGCRFRHAQVVVKRGDIECHFEKSEKGCQKYHCPFKHQESRQVRMERLKDMPLDEVILPLKINNLSLDPTVPILDNKDIKSTKLETMQQPKSSKSEGTRPKTKKSPSKARR